MALDADVIKKSDYSAKGKILIGTGTGTFTALSVGSNGQVLTADSNESSGIKWTTSSTTDEKVKADSGDTSAGYLDAKVDGATIVISNHLLKTDKTVIKVLAEAPGSPVNGETYISSADGALYFYTS